MPHFLRPAPKPLTTLVLIATTCVQALAAADSPDQSPPTLIDPDATPQTLALYRNLKELAPQATLFGAQATLAYGYHWFDEEGRSDVKTVTGSYPAVYGWDVMEIELPTEARSENHYRYDFDDRIRWAKEAYARGGVITYAWHKSNPVSGKNFYDKTPAAATLLPGGENHEAFMETLDRLATFFKAHEEVPIIFRPWHEHNGDWFWWGKGYVSEENYIALWRLTVDTLRDEKGVHNLIYAFSPDRSRMYEHEGRDAYFYAYPGDNYVDIIGIDNYWDVGHPGNRKPKEERIEDFVASLELVVSIANEKNKVAALTETGLDRLEDPTWWTEVLLAGINRNETTRQIAYLQVWRNANRELEGRDHFYVPYEGHPSVPSFIEFKNDPSILFEDELPDLYQQSLHP
ncbi:glycosyl hydrolase [Pelagicoccus sp. SDUM812003]|uniref:glycoside hydrolase family 26 protein n=1 Tax=Pelagicoccus sp. SDUM812003 TaxID=3041267 RepID=UPI00280CB187|nr:glycosyl hydrolase [Pelagicoccus sp. SDUM812003]MDQ8204611.1 glycosyl hydrolase [Pelagicoccus sp. SDUM812003]